MENPLKKNFENLKNRHGNIYVKKIVEFLNKFLSFQSCNYKISIKINHVSKVLSYVENTQEKHVDKWFFCIKSPFPLLNVHQIVSNFL